VNRVKNGVGLLVGIVIGAVVAAPVGVLASHRFGDVPDSSPLHDDVETLDAAGVVRGCGSGQNYCPDRPVTRGQMAQYLSRSMPSVSTEDFQSPLLTAPAPVPIGRIDVEVPGRPGGRQFVRVDASIVMYAPCNLCSASFHLGDESGEQSTPRTFIAGNPSRDRGTIVGVFEADSGTTETLTLYGHTGNEGHFEVFGDLVAETFPRGNAAG
jgi:hypothetical protein